MKDIRDKAKAMAAYARQAKDTELIQYATDIKIRAERRCGELLAVTEKNRGAAGSGSNQHEVRSHDTTAPTLAEMGLTKSESSRYQQLAAMPADHFETTVALVNRAGFDTPKGEDRRYLQTVLGCGGMSPTDDAALIPLTLVLTGASEAEIATGLAAARGVLECARVNPAEAERCHALRAAWLTGDAPRPTDLEIESGAIFALAERAAIEMAIGDDVPWPAGARLLVQAMLQ